MSTSAKEIAKTRQEQLAEAEQKIHQASRDTVESIRVIGRELTKIENESLYEVMGENDFQEYVEVHLRLDYHLARAWMRASSALDLLDRQKLQLPYNQSQVLELSKLKTPEMLIGVWQKILTFCTKEKQAITHDMVRNAVSAARTKTQEFVSRSRGKKAKPVKGIEVDLSESNGEKAPDKQSLWSEEGEKALNRIRRLCGDAIADAIDECNPKITERELLKWAEQEPEMVKNLAYYIVTKRWTVKKAMAYEAESINLSTTVEQLADLARSRGGRAYAEFEDVRLTIEIAS